MAVVRDLSTAQLAFEIIGGDADQFHVVRYHGTEGLCQLFQFKIDLISSDHDIDIDKIVGTSAILTVQSEFGERTFHGLVSRFETAGKGSDQATYHVELVPAIWLLTHRYQSRIFQQKTVPEIVADVSKAAGVPADRLKQQLSATYRPREYCVQYRETDYNFICRLMEEEGIWWYFEHSKESHILVMADAISSYVPIEGDTALPYVPISGIRPQAEHVFRFRRSQTIRPGVVTLRDYSFERPDLNLDSKQDLGRDSGLEFSDYPGEYAKQSEGTSLAKVRGEEFDAGRITAIGQSDCCRLAPARTFQLADHPTRACNDSYVVTSVSYQGQQATAMASATAASSSQTLRADLMQSLVAVSQREDGNVRMLAEAILHLGGQISAPDPTVQPSLPSWLYHAGQLVRDLATVTQAMGGNPLQALACAGLGVERPSRGEKTLPSYECQFECIPSKVAFRPPRITPWPVMRGSQTARVVGPKGEEIHTDKYGRVMVQFPWDRHGQYDEKSSCWIRVSQGMAGGAYGMLFLPRVGQEVVVDFLEGDPDRPLIVGRVYNADHMPPYDLPKEKTKSVIKTHSSKGGGGTNEIRFEDLKDKEQLLIHAQKNFHLRVREEERHNIGKTQHLTVTEEQRIKVGKHRSVDVAGKDALHVADTRNVCVDGDVIENLKGNHGHQVASQYYIKANELVIEADSGISFKVGGNFIVINSSGVKVKGTKIGLNSGGAALSKSAQTSPASPAAPEEADTVQPGKDKNYTGEPSELPPIEEKKYEGHWISIDLKNDQGESVPGEYYEILTPSGKKLHGTLDVNGFARNWVDEPGNCEISFPNLQSEEWKQG